MQNDINTQIECGTKQIIIRPGVYSMFDAEIKAYRIGDCFFDALSFDEIEFAQQYRPNFFELHILSFFAG